MNDTNGKKQKRKSEKSPVKSALGLVIWRIKYTFAMFLITVFLIGIGFAVGLVLIEQIRTNGL